MAWSELSYAASPDHEEYLGKLRSIFHPDSQSPLKTSSSRWRPHLSIAYDNPENTVLSLPHTVQMIAKIPSLVTHGPRKVVGISLWRTRGNMIEWTCLERIQL